MTWKSVLEQAQKFGRVKPVNGMFENLIFVIREILLVTQCLIVLIRKNIGSIKFISGEAADVFCVRTIVHCVTNLSWFCNQTSYLMFFILGQWNCHDFESIQPCISSFSFPWDMEFVMVLSPYFTSDSIFFHIKSTV